MIDRTFERNSTGQNIIIKFHDEVGDPIVPTLDIVDVYGPGDQIILNGLVPTEIVPGQYQITIDLDKTLGPGVYKDVWKNVNISGVGVSDIGFTFSVFAHQENEIHLWAHSNDNHPDKPFNSTAYGYNQ